MTEHLSRLNFRDLGGLCAANGRRVRSGLLYRSEGPASFLVDHRRELAEIGFRLVCDLRADVERSAAPNDWVGSARLLNIDITNDLRTEANEGWGALRHDPSAAGAARAMTLNYAAMPGAILPHLAPLVDALVAGETPALIHCTAGKDRTGVLVALLLRALGVEVDVIERDYVRSDVFAKNLRLGGPIVHAFEKSFGFTPSAAIMDAMIGVDRAFLHAALQAIDAEWGSMAGYLAAAGIDELAMARFRDALLTAKATGTEEAKNTAVEAAVQGRSTMDLEANKQLVIQFFDAIAAGDTVRLDQLMTADATWWVSPSTVFSGLYNKPEFLAGLPQLFANAAGPFTFTYGELTAEDDRVSLTAKGHQLMESGKTYASDYHFLLQVRDGQIAAGREYLDSAHVGEIFGIGKEVVVE